MPSLSETASVMRAAGEESRLRILMLLAVGELSVKDIVDILGQSQPRVSRHLRILAEAGLVERHAEGAWAYFRLADTGFAGQLARSLAAATEPGNATLVADRARLEAVRGQRRAEADAYFAEVAATWDQVRSLHAPDAAVEAGILEMIGPEPVKVALDLGTGTGRMLELLAPLYQRGIGIDSSRAMIAVARANLAGAGLRHAQVRMGDIADLPADVAAGNLVLLHQVLHYFDNPELAVRGAADKLAAGGTMLIADFEPHQLDFLRDKHAHRRLGLSDEQMQAWARAAGLEIDAKTRFPNERSADGLTVSLWRLRRGTGTGEEIAA